MAWWLLGAGGFSVPSGDGVSEIRSPMPESCTRVGESEGFAQKEVDSGFSFTHAEVHAEVQP